MVFGAIITKKKKVDKNTQFSHYNNNVIPLHIRLIDIVILIIIFKLN